MFSQEHSEYPQRAIESLTEQCFRVIKFDKVVPDAIALRDKEITAIEIQTYGANRPLSAPTCYQDLYHTIVVAREHHNRHHNQIEFNRALELRRQGLTYSQIVQKSRSRIQKAFLA
ncbi:MAG: hypothetical protein ACYCQJ_03920 [Nitrososphaerales archaeon]